MDHSSGVCGSTLVVCGMRWVLNGAVKPTPDLPLGPPIRVRALSRCPLGLPSPAPSISRCPRDENRRARLCLPGPGFNPHLPSLLVRPARRRPCTLRRGSGSRVLQPHRCQPRTGPSWVPGMNSAPSAPPVQRAERGSDRVLLSSRANGLPLGRPLSSPGPRLLVCGVAGGSPARHLAPGTPSCSLLKRCYSPWM